MPNTLIQARAIAIAIFAAGFCNQPQCVATEAQTTTLANPAIDMSGYLAVAKEAADWRRTHRLSESEFLRLSKLPDTIVLDARSIGKYAELHVRGAINLSFP